MALALAVLAAHLAGLQAGARTSPLAKGTARIQARWMPTTAPGPTDDRSHARGQEAPTEAGIRPSPGRPGTRDAIGEGSAVHHATSTSRIMASASAAAPPASSPTRTPDTSTYTPAADTLGAPVPRIPTSRHLRYTLRGSRRGQPIDGQAHLHWSHDGARYEARLVQATPAGERVQQSEGILGPEGLRPERFGDRAAGGRSEQAAHFERDPSGTGGRIRFSGNQPDAAFTAGSQDRLSVLVQLAALAAASRQPLRPGQTLRMPVATVREARTWTFEVEVEEDLTVNVQSHQPPQTWRTLRLRHRPEAAYDQELVVWLAPALDYLPVRLRLTQAEGDWLEQQWDPADAR